MTQAEHRRDRLFGVGMCIVSAALAIQSFRYPAESAQFPRFLSVLLVLLSALLAIRSLRSAPAGAHRVAQDERPATTHDQATTLWRSPALFVFGTTAIYILAIEWLGFLTGSIVFMVGCPLCLGSRHWVTLLTWGVTFPLALYLMFHTLLRLPLPAGWLM